MCGRPTKWLATAEHRNLLRLCMRPTQFPRVASSRGRRQSHGGRRRGIVGGGSRLAWCWWRSHRVWRTLHSCVLLELCPQCVRCMAANAGSRAQCTCLRMHAQLCGHVCGAAGWGGSRDDSSRAYSAVRSIVVAVLPSAPVAPAASSAAVCVAAVASFGCVDVNRRRTGSVSRITTPPTASASSAAPVWVALITAVAS